MEPKNHPIEKENHLPNLHFWVQHVNFPVLMYTQENEMLNSTHFHTKALIEAVAEPKISVVTALLPPRGPGQQDDNARICVRINLSIYRHIIQIFINYNLI